MSSWRMVMSCLPLAANSGRYFGHWIVEQEASLFVELHDGWRSGKHFGQRGDVKDRVFLHDFGPRYQRAISVCFVEDDVAVVADDHYCTWKFLCRDAALDDAVDRREILLRNCIRLLFRDKEDRDDDDENRLRAVEAKDHAWIFLEEFRSGIILLIVQPSAKVSSEPIRTNHVQAILGNTNETPPNANDNG